MLLGGPARADCGRSWGHPLTWRHEISRLVTEDNNTTYENLIFDEHFAKAC